MIDEIGFDTGNAFGLCFQSEGLQPPDESLPTPPLPEEKISSLRTSNRKLRALQSSPRLDINFNEEKKDLKAIQNFPILPPTTSQIIDDISADSKKYFFEKMKKKGIHEAEKIYGQYIDIGFSPKASIALTDRQFFPNPHEKHHGIYLKQAIGEELFKKEQAARKGKEEWIPSQIPEKINYTALKALEASLINSKTSSNPSNKHLYQQSGNLGGYLLGIAEIIAGGALVVTGGALEIATCGGFTLGLGVTVGTGVSLMGLGIATTAANAQGISAPNFPKYDPV